MPQGGGAEGAQGSSVGGPAVRLLSRVLATPLVTHHGPNEIIKAED